MSKTKHSTQGASPGQTPAKIAANDGEKPAVVAKRKGIGRPKKSRIDKKTHRIPCNASPRQLAVIKDKAQEAGLPISTYLVEAGVKSRVINENPKPAMKIDRDVAMIGLRIGVNLNQIAKEINTDLGYTPRDVSDNMKKLARWIKQVEDAS